MNFAQSGPEKNFGYTQESGDSDSTGNRKPNQKHIDVWKYVNLIIETAILIVTGIKCFLGN